MNDQPERIDHDVEQAARLTALVLGELNGEVEVELVDSLRDECEEIGRVAGALLKSDRTAIFPEASVELRKAVESKLSGDAGMVELNRQAGTQKSRGRWVMALSAGLLLLLLAVAVSNSRTDNLLSRSLAVKFETAKLQQKNAAFRADSQRADDHLALEQAARRFGVGGLSSNQAGAEAATKDVEEIRSEIRFAEMDRDEDFAIVAAPESQSRHKELKLLVTPRIVITDETQEQLAVSGRPTQVAGTNRGSNRSPAITYVAPPSDKSFAAPKYLADAEVVRGRARVVPITPTPNQLAAGPNARGAGTAVINYGRTVQKQKTAEPVTQYHRQGLTVAAADRTAIRGEVPQRASVRFGMSRDVLFAAEQYSQIVENRFTSVNDEPLSTFSIDVDTASYANARRFLTQNQMPPANAIRIEEFINYFGYDYPAPKEGEPFSVNMEVAQCPWQPAHQLVRIGLKGKKVPQEERPASNIVFLLDVSGSMQDANKLPLLKQAMKLLTDQLTESDRVSIITYAGNAGLSLETTNGESKQTIRDAIDALNANGSTNGSAGIQLAYEKATESFLKQGANRVILATDGDLNVGVTDDDALVELIREQATSGVFLTVLGFGEGNLQDGKLEKLADNGNGMYAYVDSLREARKVLVEQISGSLVTIAKDVKIKVEFNPAEVAAYRLLGYENRLMSAPDFDNDAKDAGEIGAGHSVTALYEIVPIKIREQLASTGLSLKYQRTAVPNEPPKELTAAAGTGELLTLFLRYKRPDANESTLSEFTVENKQRAFDDASPDFRFAAAVASFGMVLRNSEFRGNSSLADVEQIASSAIGSDQQGHRTDFLDLVRRSSTLQAERK